MFQQGHLHAFTKFIRVHPFKSNISYSEKDGVFTFTLRRVVTYLSKGAPKSHLERIPAGSTLELDFRACEFLDADIEEVIADFLKHSGFKNITVKEIR